MYEINRLRPFAQDIWRTLSEADRSRFFRHLKSIWDAHRHRLPPEARARLMQEIGSGRTLHRAGRVLAVAGEAPRQVEIRRRGEGAPSLVETDLVVDCSGFRADLDAP
ncbi:MAG TPA: hypothetical protein VFR34_02690 [Paracoccaceae bacterium]|nr:hypothetical protein [Paracoccaceae bacterium]